MTTNSELIERIDWENIMKMPRNSGGHDSQMEGLFKDIEVLAHWNEGDYQGQIATMVRLLDTNEVVMYSDYYGSCSGCDAWEDATDIHVRDMCIGLAGVAKIFSNMDNALNFLSEMKELGKDFEFSDEVRTELLKEFWKTRSKRGLK